MNFSISPSQLCSHTPSALNAEAKRSDVPYGHALMALLGEGSEATEPYDKYEAFFWTCATQIHFRTCATQIYFRTCELPPCEKTSLIRFNFIKLPIKCILNLAAILRRNVLQVSIRRRSNFESS